MSAGKRKGQATDWGYLPLCDHDWVRSPEEAGLTHSSSFSKSFSKSGRLGASRLTYFESFVAFAAGLVTTGEGGAAAGFVLTAGW